MRICLPVAESLVSWHTSCWTSHTNMTSRLPWSCWPTNWRTGVTRPVWSWLSLPNTGTSSLTRAVRCYWPTCGWAACAWARATASKYVQNNGLDTSPICSPAVFLWFISCLFFTNQVILGIIFPPAILLMDFRIGDEASTKASEEGKGKDDDNKSSKVCSTTTFHCMYCISHLLLKVLCYKLHGFLGLAFAYWTTLSLYRMGHYMLIQQISTNKCSWSFWICFSSVVLSLPICMCGKYKVGA